jgi:hypothetical protein
VDDDELCLPGTAPPGFVRRTIVVEAGGARPADEREWHDAIVVVEHGEIELECAAGGRRRFAAGAVLWLTGIDLRVLHNRGAEPAVLVAVRRHRDGEPHAPPR